MNQIGANTRDFKIRLEMPKNAFIQEVFDKGGSLAE